MTDKRRILILSPVFPPDVGGVETVMRELITRFGENGAVVAPDNSKAEAFDAQQAATIVRYSCTSDRLAARTLAIARQGHRLLKKKKYQSILCCHIDALHAAAILSKWWGIPYTLVSYGMEILGLPEGLKGEIYTAPMNNTHHHFTISEFSKSLLTAKGIAEQRITVLPLGCDRKQFHPEVDTKTLPQELLLHSEYNPLLLSVGRLVPRKGHDRLIAAMPDIVRQIPKARLIIAGDGPHREALESQIRDLTLQEHVHLLGRVAQADLPALYNLADCFILPVRQIGCDVEGFGLVFLEAMACGCPVIAGRSGGVPDAVPDGTGILIDPESREEIASAVIDLTQNQTRRETLTSNGLQHVQTTMTWDHCYTQLQHMLDTLTT